MASGAVFSPPPTSTSGIRCGGLNGWPSTTRSGCVQADCMALTARPDELEASSAVGGAAASMRA